MSPNFRGNLRRVTLLPICRKLRRGSTEAEKMLWELLRGGQLAAKFRRQHQFGLYVLDFYCAEHKLAVEADGSQHLLAAGSAKDESRDDYLKAHGVRVLRFTNVEILSDIEGVRQAIWRVIQPPGEVSDDQLRLPELSERGKSSLQRVLRATSDMMGDGSPSP